jgi:hypothetical protein
MVPVSDDGWVETHDVTRRSPPQYKLPDGAVTEDRDQWAAAWVRLGKAVEPFFPGYEAISFDPLLEFVTHTPRPFAASFKLTPDQAQLLLAYTSNLPPIEHAMPKYTIAEIVDKFQRDLTAAVIDHVTELLAPLGPRAEAPAPATALPPALPSASSTGDADKAARMAAKPAPKRQLGEKRDRKVIAAVAEVLATYITKHPGQRVEQINAGLNLTTPEVVLPLRQLIKAGRVRTTGKLRATRYFPTTRYAPAAKAAPAKPAMKGKSKA